MSIVKSDKMMSPVEYLKLVFSDIEYGKDVHKDDIMTADALRAYLDNNGKSELWDYPLSEIDELLEHGTPVVLVYFDLNMGEVRWFELPEE